MPAREPAGAPRRSSVCSSHRPVIIPAVLPSQQLMIDPTAQSALMGLIEVRRYRAIVLRRLGRPAESEAAIASAQMLARANQMAVPLVAARLTRTVGDHRRRSRQPELAADAGLTSSRQDFTQVVPQTRPVAETALLQAGVAAKQGDTARAARAVPLSAPHCCASCARAPTRRCWNLAWHPTQPKPTAGPATDRRCWGRCSRRRSWRRTA